MKIIKSMPLYVILCISCSGDKGLDQGPIDQNMSNGVESEEINLDNPPSGLPEIQLVVGEVCEEDFCPCWEVEGDPNPNDFWICDPSIGSATSCGVARGETVSQTIYIQRGYCKNDIIQFGWSCGYRDNQPGCEKTDMSSRISVGHFEKNDMGYFIECEAGYPGSCSSIDNEYEGDINLAQCVETGDFQYATFQGSWEIPLFEKAPGIQTSYWYEFWSTTERSSLESGQICLQTSDTFIDDTWQEPHHVAEA